MIDKSIVAEGYTTDICHRQYVGKLQRIGEFRLQSVNHACQNLTNI